jgi:hypothetical protein
MTDDAWADDDDEHEDGGESVALELAVGTLAGGVTGVVGYAVGGLDGAVVANAATPYLAAMFHKVVSPVWADRSRRADAMLETAAEAAELSPEQLAERAGESEETRYLTDKAIQAAANTIWPEGIRAIGRAYAAGLLAKEKPVLDIRLRVLGIMQDLDEMHVSLLELLVKYERTTKYNPDVQRHELVAIAHRFPSYHDRSMGGERPGNPKVWSVGRRKWRTVEISAVRPHLGLVLGSLLGELRASGLVEENDTAPDAIEQLGKQVTQQMNRQAGQMSTGQRVQQINASSVTPNRYQLSEQTWSPTELGEKILGFYAEAGSEDSHAAPDSQSAN